MSDHGTLLRGTAANVIGLAFGVAAAFGVQLLLGRRLPAGGLSLVTVAVQVAFVASAGSRFGMDMTAIRRVAIDGADEHAAQLRSLVDRAAGVAAAASVTVAVLVAAGALLVPDYRRAIVLASLSIPFIACANVYLGATRGLKRMTPTLWVFWIGQPVVWIAAAAIGIALGGSTDWAVLAYGLSWVCATMAARVWWRRLSLGLGSEPATAEQLREALRYGLPRAPSALLAQSLFWADLFVLGFYASGRPLDAYAAAGRVSQVVLLFLTSVSLIFSPFAADLHARGETARLDRLFKDSTRWALAATLPVLIILFVEAGDILRAFGPGFGAGTTQLRIMLAGQAVNVATGSVAVVLVMVGRTGLDALDNLAANIVLISAAAVLASQHGPNGAAVASAVTLAGVNVVRLVQVRSAVRIQPLAAVHLRLAVPAAAGIAAAVAAHVAMRNQPWWASVIVVAAACCAAYAALLAPGLPAHERRAVRARLRPSSRRIP